MAKSSSQRSTDFGSPSEGSSFNEKLKTFGVDTDVMAEAAKEQAASLQDLLAEEIRNRPWRALGIAAAIGLFAGLIVR